MIGAAVVGAGALIALLWLREPGRPNEAEVVSLDDRDSRELELEAA